MAVSPALTALDFDGRVLRITRRWPYERARRLGTVAWRRWSAGGGLGPARRRRAAPVVALAVATCCGPARSGPTAWQQAAWWGQNPTEQLRQGEVAHRRGRRLAGFLFPQQQLDQPACRVPPMVPTGTAGQAPLPDGVRLVLSLTPGQAVSGAPDAATGCGRRWGRAAHECAVACSRRPVACAQARRGPADGHADGGAGGHAGGGRLVAAVAQRRDRGPRARAPAGRLDPDRRAGLGAADPARGCAQRRPRPSGRALEHCAARGPPVDLSGHGPVGRRSGRRRLPVGSDHRRPGAAQRDQSDRWATRSPSPTARRSRACSTQLGLDTAELDTLVAKLLRAASGTAVPDDGKAPIPLAAAAGRAAGLARPVRADARGAAAVCGGAADAHAAQPEHRQRRGDRGAHRRASTCRMRAIWSMRATGRRFARCRKSRASLPTAQRLDPSQVGVASRFFEVEGVCDCRTPRCASAPWCSATA